MAETEYTFAVTAHLSGEDRDALHALAARDSGSLSQQIRQAVTAHLASEPNATYLAAVAAEKQATALSQVVEPADAHLKRLTKLAEEAPSP
jgi:hypothetical protein